MRSIFFLVLLTGSSFAITGVRGDEPKNDATAILGEWGATAYTDNGEDAFGEKIAPKESSVRWNIEKKKLYFLADVEEATVEGTYKLDASAKPRQLDVVMASPLDPEQKQRLKGIYELKGDKLKVCYGPDGVDRPKKFGSKEGSKLILIEFERIKL